MTYADAYKADEWADVPAHIRGPLGYEPRDTRRGSGVAIGFCARCGMNARQSTKTRGLFDCPGCTYVWWDARVGKQTKSIDDFMSPA